MTLAGYVSLGLILVVWLIVPRHLGGGRLLLFSALVLAGALLYLTGRQFLIWQQGEITQFLLPPHQSISYFVYYSFTRFWRPYLVSGAVGLVALGLAVYFNKKYDQRFFYQDEPYYLALGLFLTGHPGWILYLALLLAIYLLVASGYTLVARKMPRISFYYFWLPLAVVTILLDAWLLRFDWYSNFIV